MILRTVRAIRSKNLHTWVGGWGRHLARGLLSGPAPARRHLLFALCDHYEPKWRNPTAAQSSARVRAWAEGYPRLAGRYRDGDGRPPRHSFFFPGEEYEPEYLEALAGLARAGLGEVELHLHHDADTAAGVRQKIHEYLALYARHGHLARDPDGRLRYAFIHGNWALANGRADGTRCGVDGELPILWETGCYADLTFPAAPDECQTRVVNQIYWPTGDLSRRRSYDHGERARVGVVRDDRILLLTGPLGLALRAAPVPLSIEAGDVTGHFPASARRVRSWVSQNVHVAGRPEWVFVKVHTHGAQEDTAASLLGPGGAALHDALARYNDGAAWTLHYVTAREMYNIARAAMDGKTGDPGAFRDYVLAPPPVARAGAASLAT
jgi:hypothetical protein